MNVKAFNLMSGVNETKFWFHFNIDRVGLNVD